MSPLGTESPVIPSREVLDPQTVSDPSQPGLIVKPRAELREANPRRGTAPLPRTPPKGDRSGCGLWPSKKRNENGMHEVTKISFDRGAEQAVCEKRNLDGHTHAHVPYTHMYTKPF